MVGESESSVEDASTSYVHDAFAFIRFQTDQCIADLFSFLFIWKV